MENKLFDKKSLNLLLELPPEYVAIIWGLYTLGIKVKKFYFVGARGTGKTVAIKKTQAYHPMWGMIRNPHTHAYSIMNKANENKEKTQREFDAILKDTQDRYWPGMYDDQWFGKWIANNDRIAHDREYTDGYIHTMQEHLYTSIEKLGELGGRPARNPDGTTGAVLSAHYEEIIGSGLRTKSDIQKHKDNLMLVDNFRQTIMRKVGLTNPDDYFAEFWSFNNWTLREETVKKVIDKLQEAYGEDITPENEYITKVLDIGGDGYLFHYDPEEQVVYFLTGIGLLYKWDKWRESIGEKPVLPKQWYEEAEWLRKEDWEEYALKFLGIPYESGNMPLQRLTNSYKYGKYNIRDYKKAEIYVDQSGGRTKTGMTLVFYNDLDDVMWKAGIEIEPKSGTDFKTIAKQIITQVDKWDRKYNFSGNYNNKKYNVPWCLEKDLTIDIYIDPSNPPMLFEIEALVKTYNKAHNDKFDYLTFPKKQLKGEMDLIRKEPDKEKRIKKTAQKKEMIVPILEDVLRYKHTKFDKDAKVILENWRDLKIDDDGKIIPFEDHLFDASSYFYIRNIKRFRKLYDPHTILERVQKDKDFHISLEKGE